MKRQIRRISILQSSKVATILYALFGLIYVPIGCGMFVFAPDDMKFLGFIYFFMPILTAVLGFIFFVIFAWLYNVIAGWVGGFEFEVESVDPPASTIGTPVS